MGSGISKRKRRHRIAAAEKTKFLIKSLLGHTGGINCMDVTESAKYLLTGADDRTARVWDLESGHVKVVLEGHQGYISCCMVWQEKFALTGSVDKTIRKWNMLSGNCIMKMEMHKGIVNRLLAYGVFLFSSSYDRSIICWNITTGIPVRVLRGHKQSILPLLYMETVEHDPQGAVDIDRNKDAIISGSMDCTAKIWSINAGTCLRTFRGHQGAILCMEIDGSKTYLFTGSADFSIKKWNVANGNMLITFKSHQGSVICVEIHQKLLYSASVDCTARCWVAEFGDATRKYVGHEHMLSDMKYYSNILLTASGDNSVRAFDARSGALKRTFKGHKAAVNCILVYLNRIYAYAACLNNFSTKVLDNRMLSGSYDGCIKIWKIGDLISLKSKLQDASTLSVSTSSVSSSIDNEVSSSEKQSPSLESNRLNFKNEHEKSIILKQQQEAVFSRLRSDIDFAN